MPLVLEPVRTISQHTNVSQPDKCVNFFDSMFDFVVSVCGLDPQLKDKSINFVYQEGDFDAFLESMAYYSFSIYHHLCPTLARIKGCK